MPRIRLFVRIHRYLYLDPSLIDGKCVTVQDNE